MPEADPVLEARRLIEDRGRRPEWDAAERPYFCRHCSLRVLGTSVPRGWYILTRTPGNSERAVRLGLFCSAACLVAHGPRFRGIEEDLGSTWDTVPSPYRG